MHLHFIKVCIFRIRATFTYRFGLCKASPLLTRVTELVRYTMTAVLVHFGCSCLTNNITF